MSPSHFFKVSPFNKGRRLLKSAGPFRGHQAVGGHCQCCNLVSCICNLRPLLKGETLKKWLGDIFENGSGCVFQKSLKKGVLFQTILKKRVHFHPGPRPRPGGVFFQTQFENGPFFQNSLKKVVPFSNFFEKHTQTHFQNCHQATFSKFHHLIRDANYKS